MAKALRKLSPYWFMLPDEPEDNPTRWRIKPLNGEELTEVQISNKVVGFDNNGDPIVQTDARSVALALKFGLIGWENFSDGENDIEYSEVNKKYISFEDRLALSWEIVKNSNMSLELEKKS